MVNPAPESAKPWTEYIGAMVMTGIAIISGVDACVATVLGNSAVARISLQTMLTSAFAALGSLVYIILRHRKRRLGL